MDLNAFKTVDDRMVQARPRTRYRLKFSKYLEFKKGFWEQEIIVNDYCLDSLGYIGFDYDSVSYRVTLRNLDMIAEVNP